MHRHRNIISLIEHNTATFLAVMDLLSELENTMSPEQSTALTKAVADNTTAANGVQSRVAALAASVNSPDPAVDAAVSALNANTATLNTIAPAPATP